ncbi:MAG: glycoside hydrolase family 5 protein [Fibrobacterales bacterium]
MKYLLLLVMVVVLGCSEENTLVIGDSIESCQEMVGEVYDACREGVQKDSVDNNEKNNVGQESSAIKKDEVSDEVSSSLRRGNVESSGEEIDDPESYEAHPPAGNDGSSSSERDDLAWGSSSDDATDKPRYIDPDIEIIQTGTPNWLSRKGTSLYDSKGNKVRLTGVNWFGFETSSKVMHGLWGADYKVMLQLMVDLGFNSIRIPWANVIIGDDEAVQVNSYEMNAELVGKNPIEALVVIANEAQRLGLKIILDNHSRVNDAYMTEDLWYTESFSEQQWIDDWKYIADVFKDNDAVIAMDLNNEPHDRATWGSGDPKLDWAMAAEKCGNAILEVNPNVLIMVEGVEGWDGMDTPEGEGYWWGGSLVGVKDRPIVLTNPEKLVYSPHEYGPTVFEQEWFKTDDFPSNMPGIWDTQFGFIAKEGEGHLFIGELGIKGKGGDDEIWFDAFLKYMEESKESYSWTFWAWNPNSGDTGGILEYDWETVVQWKVDYLKPYLAPLIGNGNG